MIHRRYRMKIFLPSHSVVLLLCMLGHVLIESASGADKPNIVFILADDLGIGDIGPYGQQTLQTPNLDQLAGKGMRFLQMYSGAPVCGPSRATLMTGLHNGRHRNGNGVPLQAGNVTVNETLKSAGYQTGSFGKWHLGSSGASLPAQQGIDEFFGIFGASQSWDHYQPTMQRMSSDAPSTVVTVNNNGGYTDDLVAAEAAQYIRAKAQTDQPFFTQVNFQLVHFDMEVPALEPYTVNQPWDLSRKIFASMVTRLDRLVGDVVSAVDDPNNDGDTSDSIADNTLIIFASDNGTHIEPFPAQQEQHGPDLGVFGAEPHDPEFFDSNGQYRGHKRDLYDGGIKTPFLARWDGVIQPGSVNHDLFGDFSDFLPTAAELAGVDSPVGVDGESYAHVLKREEAGPRDYERPFLYFENGSRIALVRNGYKAIRNGGSIELYDLLEDPSESNNLYNSMRELGDEMIAIAVSQDGGEIGYFTNGSSGSYSEPAGWNGGSVPGANSIVSLQGEGDLLANGAVNVVGLEIGGGPAPTNFIVNPGSSLSAQNNVRVLEGSQLRLEQTTAALGKRLELFGGSLKGSGDVVGSVVNRGNLSPDGATSGPVVPPPQAASEALVFDFTGVQDDAPLTQLSVLHPHLQLTAGFAYGLGAQPRSAGPNGSSSTNAGNEFNAGGFDAGSLSGAIAADDYLTFTVQAVGGFEMHLRGVSFDMWRNGANAANDYAILTSLDGFVAGQQIGELNNLTTSGQGSQLTFAATRGGVETTADPVEVRLYAWNANDGLANTHVNDVRLDALFVRAGADDALDFNFSGVQDTQPLSAALVQNPRLTLVEGFQYGPGAEPRNADGNTNLDAGDEFNASGFDASSLSGAIAGDDYLTYTVRPVDGFTMQLGSVSYDLWRNGPNAATDYAIMTSIDGFTAGSELSQLNNVTGEGAASQQTYTGLYSGGLSVTGPTEIRLYAWNAGDELANTHITAVSLDATFSLAPQSQEADPLTGRVTLNGDYLQLAEGVLTLDVSDEIPGDEHDQLVVSGHATLDGMIIVRFSDDFDYQPGDRFEFLTADAIVGQFAEELLPALAGGFTLSLQYEEQAVTLVVGGVAGDYNLDGVVDAVDYAVWRDSIGQTGVGLAADGDRSGVVDQADFQVWRNNYGQSAAELTNASQVPEPASSLMGFAVPALLFIPRSNANRPDATL